MLNWNCDNRWSRTSFSYSSKFACKFLSFAHFLKRLSHHSVLFFVFSFSLFSINFSIYSKREAIVEENNFSIEWAVARRPKDQSWASNFALFTKQNYEKNNLFIDQSAFSNFALYVINGIIRIIYDLPASCGMFEMLSCFPCNMYKCTFSSI